LTVFDRRHRPLKRRSVPHSSREADAWPELDIPIETLIKDIRMDVGIIAVRNCKYGKASSSSERGNIETGILPGGDL
jgi:hypothetical protein